MNSQALVHFINEVEVASQDSPRHKNPISSMKEKVDKIRGHQSSKSQFAKLAEQCDSESSSNKSEEQKQEGGP